MLHFCEGHAIESRICLVDASFCAFGFGFGFAGVSSEGWGGMLLKRSSKHGVLWAWGLWFRLSVDKACLESIPRCFCFLVFF